jgi:hypothetical protein
MWPEGAQVELQREQCVPKVLKLSSEVSECKPLAGGLSSEYKHVGSITPNDDTIGGAVQVDPIKPTLKAPGSTLLKLRYGGPV